MAAKKFRPPQPKKTWKHYLTNKTYQLYGFVAVFGIIVLGVMIYLNIRANLGHDPWDVAKGLFLYQQALTEYRASHGNYPTLDDGGLSALRAPSSTQPQLPPDPAGNPYTYVSTAETYVVRTRLGGKNYWLSNADSAATTEEMYRLITTR